MYEALGNRLIVEKPTERVSDSGIVLPEQGGTNVFLLTVISAPDEHSRFIGKTIVAERHRVIEFGEGTKIGAVKIEDILAVKE